MSLFKSFLLGGICLLMLTAFGQKDTSMLKMDTSNKLVDSATKKDTLLIKYIQVLPKTYQHQDAWLFKIYTPILQIQILISSEIIKTIMLKKIQHFNCI